MERKIKTKEDDWVEQQKKLKMVFQARGQGRKISPGWGRSAATNFNQSKVSFFPVRLNDDDDDDDHDDDDDDDDNDNNLDDDKGHGD